LFIEEIIDKDDRGVGSATIDFTPPVAERFAVFSTSTSVERNKDFGCISD
jgi:hypothetical protein